MTKFFVEFYENYFKSFGNFEEDKNDYKLESNKN